MHMYYRCLPLRSIVSLNLHNIDVSRNCTDISIVLYNSNLEVCIPDRVPVRSVPRTQHIPGHRIPQARPGPHNLLMKSDPGNLPAMSGEKAIVVRTRDRVVASAGRVRERIRGSQEPADPGCLPQIPAGW